MRYFDWLKALRSFWIRNEDRAALPRKLNIAGDLDIVGDTKKKQINKGIILPEIRINKLQDIYF